MKVDNFNNFVGQKRNLFLLKILAANSIKNDNALKHILISGLPGTGKTFLVKLIAEKLKRPLIRLQGNNLQRVEDINSILMNIKTNSLVFIDEIHAINPNIEELLYSAMDEKLYSLFLGQGSNSKIINLELPSFTMIGATTKIAQMSKPLVSRFTIKIYFDAYNESDIFGILKNKIEKQQVKFTKIAIDILSSVGKNNPRIALSTLEKMVEFAEYFETNIIGKKELNNFLKKACIYKYGFKRGRCQLFKNIKKL